jgi:hypothetical protein
MLLESKIDKKYWPYALRCATYLRNRSPTSANGGVKTPFEIFTGKKPNLKFIRVFGTICYMKKYNHKKEKLEDQSIKCYLVGYGPRWYELIDFETGKRYTSIHVVFQDEGHVEARDEDEDDEDLSESESEIDEFEDIKDNVKERTKFKERKEEILKEKLKELKEKKEKELKEKKEKELKEKKEKELKEKKEKEKETELSNKTFYESVKQKAPKDINGDISEENVLPDGHKRNVKFANFVMKIKDTFTKTAYDASLVELTDPLSFKEAVNREDREKWKMAIQSEWDSLVENGTFGNLIELPSGREAIKSKWVFKIKRDALGKLEKYKARLVAKGYTQRDGIDYEETFAPVASAVVLRILIALSLDQKLKMIQMDVVTAYLYSKLDKEVFLEQPEGYQVKGKESLVLPLLKGLYGLKQSAKLWNDNIKDTLFKAGFRRSENDYGLFIFDSPDEVGYLIIYVDDLVLATNSNKLKIFIENTLEDNYKITKLGEVKSILGMDISRNEDYLKISKPHYIDTKVKLFGQENAKEQRVPMVQGFKLQKFDGKIDKNYPYRSMIGSLMHIANSCRPDISYAVGYLSRFSNYFNESHWNAGMKIIRYLRDTRDNSLIYKRKITDENELIGYCDASFSQEDFRSTTGYAIYLNNKLISWKSCKQVNTALSAAEAEIVAATECIKEIIWIKNILKDLRQKVQEPIIIFEDNQACIKIAESENITSKTKHIGYKTTYLREQVQSQIIKFVYCESQNMIADILTKALGPHAFIRLKQRLGIINGGVLDVD